jgi:hypothetical protein
MVQQGIQSLMPQQAPMPGQAPQAPMPGMMPKPSAATPPAQIKLLETKPSRELRAMYDQQPTLALLTAYTRALKREQLDESMRGQQAMQQAATTRGTVADEIMSQPVMAASGGIMQGYSGGGAVAFQYGGNPEIEQILKKSPLIRTPEENEKLRAAGIELTSRKFAAPSYSSGIDEVLAAERGRKPTAMTAQQMEAALQTAPAAAPRSPSATRPGTGIAQPRPQQRPPAAPPAATGQGLGSFVEQTGTPAPDKWAEIEAGGITGIKALQDILRKQGESDPELMKLREAAYKSSQDIAARRERDRLAMLEAGQKQYDDITDLIAGAAGGAKGKTVGEVLSGAVGGAGAARTAKRAEFQKVKELSRQEQNAIDTLNQALAEKRVTDRFGDVKQREAANLKVAEAELKVADLRSGIQEKRATETDRAEQRRLTARGQDLQRLSSQEQTAATLKAASMRGTGELTESQKANLREKATDNVRQDKNLPLLLQNAKIEAQKTGRPFDQQKFIDTLILREYNRIVGKETPAAPAAGGIDPDILKLFKVTPVGG